MAEPLSCALRYLLLPTAVLLEEWEGRELEAKVGGDEQLLLLLGVSWRAAATNRRGWGEVLGQRVEGAYLTKGFLADQGLAQENGRTQCRELPLCARSEEGCRGKFYQVIDETKQETSTPTSTCLSTSAYSLLRLSPVRADRWANRTAPSTSRSSLVASALILAVSSPPPLRSPHPPLSFLQASSAAAAPAQLRASDQLLHTSKPHTRPALPRRCEAPRTMSPTARPSRRGRAGGGGTRATSTAGSALRQVEKPQARSALCWRAPKFSLPGAMAVGGGSTSCCDEHNPNSIRARAHDRPDERRRVLLFLLPLQAVAPSENGRVSDAIANVNASERETEPHIEATGADGAETGTGSPARRSPTTKVRAPKKKKKTSLIWNHFTELLVEEKADGIVIMKKMAECNCGDSIMGH